MDMLLLYIKDLYNLSRIRFVVNVLLMIALGMLEGIGVLMIIPLLVVSGIIPGIEATSGMTSVIRGICQNMCVTLSLPVVLLLYLSVIWVQSWLKRYQSLVNFDLQQSFGVLLSARLYRAVVYADWQLIISRTKSDITNIIISELMRVYVGLNYFLQITTTVLTTLIQVVICVLIAPVLTCFVLAGAIVLFIFFQNFVKESRKMGQNISDLNRNLLFDLTENLNGLKEIKSHGIELVQINNFIKIRDMMKQNLSEFSQIQTRTDMLYKVGSAVFISLFLFSAIEIFKLNPQEFIVISVISARLWPRLSSFQMGLQNINNTLPAFRAARELENQCLAAGERLPENEASKKIDLYHGVQFRNVSFYYDSSSINYSLNELNLFLPAGRTIAFVGVSGAGKSTVVDLLIGLLKPKEGNILIDGKPLLENLLQWRNSIGYVPQDAFLFNTSIRDNMLCFCPDASENEIWNALRLASVDFFVNGLQDGLDTLVGDRGIRLSGGERQRIVLARALLRKPTVLILDEATSSLDLENEKRIQEAIDGLQGKMTIVVIAHRISTIKNVDRIFVLEQGRVIEQGNYRLLMENKESRFYSLACTNQI
ncbi:ABC transporter related [Desulfofarcimen acetoxidans DSM 771]|uniref:ABC transporter related n=1 Tax=Desulfofarcimen acetoxidans (strain ATCC 49208 / DSM 771 / KCTC 5769 / VKM B-1644 / 5575) TaxID=485916 RepID=C8W5K4_DESAS|nr:ABC transporter ATP-binding protein/permease [Desulfofarcimen acetoxidans]ACV64004.1 ABC transporter related [Desulfofarcimen acetoxidans DSM 771]